MMKPLFGPGGNSDEFKTVCKSTLEAPRWVKEYGLDAYEYEAGRGVVGSEAMFAKLGENAREYGVKMSIHAPYFISLSSLEAEKRTGSAKYILDSAKALRSMGFMDGTIVIHAGSCAKLERDFATRLACDALAHAIGELQSEGLYGYSLGIETMGKVNQLGTLDEVIELCHVDKTVVPVVDFGHMNARERGGVFQTADDYMRVFDTIADKVSSFAAMHLHCHFSKIEYTAGGEKRHLTFEDETFGPDPMPLMTAIKELGVAPTIICESDGTQARDARIMKKQYEALL